MLGALIGDIAGSLYEGRNCKSKDFPPVQPGCRMTDDSIMTAAMACAVAAAHLGIPRDVRDRSLPFIDGEVREVYDRSIRVY